MNAFFEWILSFCCFGFIKRSKYEPASDVESNSSSPKQVPREQVKGVTYGSITKVKDEIEEDNMISRVLSRFVRTDKKCQKAIKDVQKVCKYYGESDQRESYGVSSKGKYLTHCVTSGFVHDPGLSPEFKKDFNDETLTSVWKVEDGYLSRTKKQVISTNQTFSESVRQFKGDHTQIHSFISCPNCRVVVITDREMNRNYKIDV